MAQHVEGWRIAKEEDLRAGRVRCEMTVRYGLEHFFTEPFPELHHL